VGGWWGLTRQARWKEKNPGEKGNRGRLRVKSGTEKSSSIAGPRTEGRVRTVKLPGKAAQLCSDLKNTRRKRERLLQKTEKDEKTSLGGQEKEKAFTAMGQGGSGKWEELIWNKRVWTEKKTCFSLA